MATDTLKVKIGSSGYSGLQASDVFYNNTTSALDYDYSIEVVTSLSVDPHLTLTGNGFFQVLANEVVFNGSNYSLQDVTDLTITTTGSGSTVQVDQDPPTLTTFTIDATAGGSDTFTFTGGGSVRGTIDAGAGTDSADYSGATPGVTVDLSALSHVETVTGSSGSDTLIGPNAVSTWNITGSNTGSVGGVSFSNFENLTSGSSGDTFVFSNNSSLISGNVVGGGSSTLDYSARSLAVTVNLATGTADGLGGFTGITTFRGSSSTDTLVGLNTTNAWTLSGTDADDVQTGGSVSSVNGEAGVDHLDESGNSSAEYFTVTGATVNGFDGTAKWVKAFTGIDDIVGGPARGDTLANGTAADGLFNVTGSYDAGDFNFAGSADTAALTFQAVENLTGSDTGNDVFNVTKGIGALTGLGGDDTFNMMTGGRPPTWMVVRASIIWTTAATAVR